MAMHATVARWRLAQHLDDSCRDERRALEARTAEWMREQGVVDPEALVEVMAPGFSGRWIASRVLSGDNAASGTAVRASA